MSRQKVLFIVNSQRRDIRKGLTKFHGFPKEFDVEFYDLVDPEPFKIELTIRFTDFSAIWARYNVLRINFNQFIEYLPKELKFVVLGDDGVDSIDGERLRERGIMLTNTGDVTTKDAADIAFRLTLGTFRIAHYFDRTLRQHRGDITKVGEEFGSERTKRYAYNESRIG